MEKEYSEMKKFITLCLALVVLASMSLVAFADSGLGGFIESPSNNQAPVVINGENASEDCEAQILITAYIDRDELPEAIRTKLEEAYKIIKETPNLSDLNEALVKISDDMGIKVTDLAVSDLFDIRSTDCVTHDEHGHFDITLKADTLKHFVCLLHFYNNEWRIVDNAEVTNNGTHLEFEEDEFSPFAIVVNTAEMDEPTAPLHRYDLPIILGASALLLLIILIVAFKRKKKEA